ncbi:23S rRNA (guanosine(2251)-2'-O)-methyltransferase RlmB [Paeniroseomonas aquatica]|uniref:23S rRNA (Guanosine(2251)-2'-O)-methyltransferase RlmB n=1 Tax=Paeniroseomonas aquatica TaxID=373043 RepID=A0ABT8AE35_9PROT|nr:23S rRNA (guanosine(2251)-2'-O)-methyltransferase RlmB [Paeniroseomonas aquatica]MDN3567614.1 23S rRNA (guanosine(2251)-2'-O)-methyltransferase RlmB [Paeniroseomonas aquatica]
MRRSNQSSPAPSRRPPVPEQRGGAGGVWLHGLHAVAAALANPARRLKRLLVTEEAEATLAARLPRADGSPSWRIAPERADRQRFGTFLPEDSVHQGAALLVEPLPNLTLDRALEHGEGPVLVLDQVTDPRNIGAILRSAAAFGASALVMQDRHAPPETGALARAASGALEVVPVVRVVNLSRALDELKKAGLWVVGLDGAAPVTLAQTQAGLGGRRVALVLGAEGDGMRRLTRENCDELSRLPIAAEMESLNVSAAAAVALYELVRGEHR